MTKKILFYTSGFILACLVLANLLLSSFSINFDNPVFAAGGGCCVLTLYDSDTGANIPNAKVEMMSKDLFQWCSTNGASSAEHTWFFTYTDMGGQQQYGIGCQPKSISNPASVTVNISKEGYPSKTTTIPIWFPKVYLSKNIISPSPKAIPTPQPSPQNLQNSQVASPAVSSSPKIPKLSLNRAPSEPLKQEPQQTKFLGITLSGRNQIILIAVLTIVVVLVASRFILSFMQKRNPQA